MTIEKLNFETAAALGPDVKLKKAKRSQNIFRAVISRAQDMGMKVNTAKTNLMVVSDAQTFTPLAEIEDSEGNSIRSTGTMKVLGFHMSDRPTVAAHVEALRKRLRQRYWILFHLKRYGFSQQELCNVYRNVIRPIADYCCVVYHSMLTDEQDEVLDRCQAHALRCIFGKDVPYAKLREKAGVTTLRQRRIELTDLSLIHI